MDSSLPRSDDLRSEGSRLRTADGREYLNLGRLPFGDATDGEAVDGRPILEAFEAACIEAGIRGRLVGGPVEWRCEFPAQDGADEESLSQALRGEFARAGVLVGERGLRLHPLMDAAAVEQAARAVARAVRRLRTLLVQHNSHYTGGLPYPFRESLAGLGAQGLAAYRFPAGAQSDVAVEGDRAVIRFAPGELGRVTSCGFYVPVFVEGDFTATLDFELLRWQPSRRDASCFALLSSNDEVPERYHAQRMSTGQGPHYVLSEMRGVVSPLREVEGRRGSLRIVRTGGTIRCLHRAGDGWLELGEGPGPEDPVQVLGAKVWGKLDCDGLEVAFGNLVVKGALSRRRIPPVPRRPDPRGTPGVRRQVDFTP